MRPDPSDSGIEVVIAATIAPVSSKWLSCNAIAARITAACHSNGIASRRTQSRHQAIVSSMKCLPIPATASLTGSSGPSTSVTASSTKNGRSSRIAVIDASVVSRSVCEVPT